MNQEELDKIKDFTNEFFNKMTLTVFSVEINPVSLEIEDILASGNEKNNNDLVNIVVKIDNPQILIGEKGQTLFETQKLLRMILNKIFKKTFYINLDINDYKKKRSEHLKSLARECAKEVIFTQKKRSLSPMSSYERKIIHAELSGNPSVKTESHGQGENRHIVIIPIK